MDGINDIVLELTNDSGFYENFTTVLRTGYENKYEFDEHSGIDHSGFRKDLLDEVKRYYGGLPNGRISENNKILYELVSHYSDEVFGKFIPADKILEFFKSWGKSHKVELEVRYVRALRNSDIDGGLVKGRVYKARPHHKYPWYLEADKGEWTTDSLNDSFLEEVAEQDYLAQEINQHLDNAKESFNKVHNDLKQVGDKPMAMKPQDVIETQVNVFGQNAATMSDDECFDAIAKVEKEIDRLTNVTSKSTKLKARVSEMKDQLQALVDYVDNRD